MRQATALLATLGAIVQKMKYVKLVLAKRRDQMKLIVNCPESDMDIYLQTVKIKINEGYISGHDSQDKNWKMEDN